MGFCLVLLLQWVMQQNETHPSQEVKNMKQNNWNRNSALVRLFLDEVEDDNLHKATLLGTLDLGDQAENDDMRTVYWTAVRNMGKGLEGFPSFAGRPSENYTPEQEANILAVVNAVKSAYASIPTEYHAMLLKVKIPHGRTGGEFADFDAMVDDEVRKVQNVMKTAIKEKRWDALSMDGNSPQITPTVVKATESEVSEEE